VDFSNIVLCCLTLSTLQTAFPVYAILFTNTADRNIGLGYALFLNIYALDEQYSKKKKIIKEINHKKIIQ
jgi:hypothetical protein